MSKVRISISLESDQAERIRSHAERAGMDVSGYMVNAATLQMAEAEAAEAEFAAVDALIAEAEGQAAEDHEPVKVDDGALSADERRAVDEALSLVYGVDDAAHRDRGDAA
ncbi:hypothetical protein [Nocardiopsis suaedae]|uniref:Ribbon-helix-helix protein, CopG family n=1 Tax=Nocardiopsis suaedae TaxID=3018444 RepID=A0ABT4TUH0_9ACTN|nr:hypothetical protein [Nocardiopsis suaedae]MDA2807792.1 hypothetical protein [Nocardiopsis suaedae]